jgi:hypothetical protein
MLVEGQGTKLKHGGKLRHNLRHVLQLNNEILRKQTHSVQEPGHRNTNTRLCVFIFRLALIRIRATMPAKVLTADAWSSRRLVDFLLNALL